MKGWAKFNLWSKTMPCTNESLQIYFNSGKGAQKNKSWLVNGRIKDLSKGTKNALKAFFEQIKPDFEFSKKELDLSRHDEPYKQTSIGYFAITDTATIATKKVGEDGLWLIREEDGFFKLYNCNNFAKLEF